MQQFENPANPEIHEKTTGPEIWKDTDGQIDVLVSGVGTGGTLTSVSRYIKNTQKNHANRSGTDSIASYYTTPERGPHNLHHTQNPGHWHGFIPKNLDLSMVDRVELVSNEEVMEYAHRLMKEEEFGRHILRRCSVWQCVSPDPRTSKAKYCRYSTRFSRGTYPAHCLKAYFPIWKRINKPLQHFLRVGHHPLFAFGDLPVLLFLAVHRSISLPYRQADHPYQRYQSPRLNSSSSSSGSSSGSHYRNVRFLFHWLIQ